ncbi:MAG: hypothetical protein PHR39_00810 [Actinomycetota bacterium]|nr:hypothetical protein [Actinomycetota bacterium]
MSPRLCSELEKRVVMKTSALGKIIHFYFISGRYIFKTLVILGILLVLSCVLIVSVPDFSMHKPDFRLSSNIFVAICQVIIGIIFLGSMAGSALLGIFVLFWFLPEIVCELLLKKKILQIIKDEKNISISTLAQKIKVFEDDLSILLKRWISVRGKFYANGVRKKFSGNHINLDLVNNKISWEE